MENALAEHRRRRLMNDAGMRRQNDHFAAEFEKELRIVMIFQKRVPRATAALFFAASMIFVLSIVPTAAQAGDAYRWTQYAAAGLEARAITQEAACPPATLDGLAAAMSTRAEPDEAFPIRVCALAIPPGTRSVAVEGAPLPLPKQRVDRLLLIGDTGCRLKKMIVQDCNTPSAWPFHRVAERAAARAPDLILHLGDLYYRESACPLERKGCSGSPFGDVWASWKADFFEPAAPMLSAAPFVFVRGNHEECARGALGWSRIFSPYPGACAKFEPPYTIDIGGVTLALLDVIAAQDGAVDDGGAAFYREQFQKLASHDQNRLWIAMHKPIFVSAGAIAGLSRGDNKTLGAAARGALPANVDLLLSGHVHMYQAVSYADDFPAQIVAGHGGDMLDPFAPTKFDGMTINGVTVEQGRSAPSKFGYALLERGANDWTLTGYDDDDAPLPRCRANGRKLACE
jgi:predicted phosphodiesterase